MLFPHGPDCACWECIEAVERAVVQRVLDQRLDINGQVDLVVRLVSENNAVELLPVLGTLQWLRDNEMKIRQRMSE